MGVEILSESPGEHGGYKEIIQRIIGRAFRAQVRVGHASRERSRDERKDALHLSLTVAILPELEEVESGRINPADCGWIRFAPRRAGGQHVNKTFRIRITHLPTGISWMPR